MKTQVFNKLQRELKAKTKGYINNAISQEMPRYEMYLTKSQYRKMSAGMYTAKELKNIFIERVTIYYIKSLNEALSNLQTIGENTNKLLSIELYIDWAKSRMWGTNPTPKMYVKTTAGGYWVEGASIGGGGYDKESAASSQVLRLCPELLRKMYIFANKRNGTKLPYGGGYGVLPYFEAGVGISCHQHIIESLGGKWKHTYCGKASDMWTITFRK